MSALQGYAQQKGPAGQRKSGTSTLWDTLNIGPQVFTTYHVTAENGGLRANLSISTNGAVIIADNLGNDRNRNRSGLHICDLIAHWIQYNGLNTQNRLVTIVVIPNIDNAGTELALSGIALGAEGEPGSVPLAWHLHVLGERSGVANQIAGTPLGNTVLRLSGLMRRNYAAIWHGSVLGAHALAWDFRAREHIPAAPTPAPVARPAPAGRSSGTAGRGSGSKSKGRKDCVIS